MCYQSTPVCLNYGMTNSYLYAGSRGSLGSRVSLGSLGSRWSPLTSFSLLSELR